MAAIQKLSAMEKSNDSHVAQCRHRGTPPPLQPYGPSRREVAASPSADPTGKSCAALSRSARNPDAEEAKYQAWRSAKGEKGGEDGEQIDDRDRRRHVAKPGKARPGESTSFSR